MATSFFAVVIQFFVMVRTVVAQKEYVRRTWMTVLVSYSTVCVEHLLTVYQLIAAPYLMFIGFGFSHRDCAFYCLTLVAQRFSY